jgi:hypothetical protein
MTTDEKIALVKANIKMTELYDDLNHVDGDFGEFSVVDNVLDGISNELYSGKTVFHIKDLAIVDSGNISKEWLSELLTNIQCTINAGECCNTIEGYVDGLVEYADLEFDGDKYDLTDVEFDDVCGSGSLECLLAYLTAEFIATNSDAYTLSKGCINVWNKEVPGTPLTFDFYGDSDGYSLSLTCLNECVDSGFEFAESGFYDDVQKILDITNDSSVDFYYGNLTDEFIKVSIIDKPIVDYYKYINHPSQAEFFLKELFKDIDLDSVFTSDVWTEISPTMNQSPELWGKALGDFLKDKIGYSFPDGDAEVIAVLNCKSNLCNISLDLHGIVFRQLAESTINRLANGYGFLENIDGVQEIFDGTSESYKSNEMTSYKVKKLSLSQSYPPSSMTF